MNDAIKKALQIPGLYDSKDAKLLYQLAQTGGELVELGCYKGRTTAVIAQACRSKGGRLTSVDMFVKPGKSYEASSPEIWRRNLRKIGVRPPRLLAMTSDEAASHFEDKKLSFVFIDASHKYEAVLNDLQNWTPLLDIGGVVALHDMWHPGIHGVCKAVAEWFSTEPRGRFMFYGQRKYTIAFRRKGK